MVAVASIPELYLPRKLPPTPRDRRIYTAVVIDGHLQADVALEAKLTQGRVAQIVKKVADWVAETTAKRPVASSDKEQEPISDPTGGGDQPEPSDAADNEIAPDAEYSQATDPEFAPDEALRPAVYVTTERLEFVYATAMSCFRRSQEDSYQKKVKQVAEKVTQETTIKKCCGQVGFSNQAMRAAMAVGRLQGVDLTGKTTREAAAEASEQQTLETNAAEEFSQLMTREDSLSTDVAESREELGASSRNRAGEILARSTNNPEKCEEYEAPNSAPQVMEHPFVPALGELASALAAA